MDWFDRFYYFDLKNILFEAQQLCFNVLLVWFNLPKIDLWSDKMAELFKCWTANPISTACVGSNDISVY